MSTRSSPGQGRARGSVEKLPSGALRVRVYAGIDSVSGRRHYLTELVKAGPKAARQAEAVRQRLLSEVAEKRNPRTSATVDQLLDRYIDQFDGAPNTLTLYRGYVRNHISPFLGHLTVSALDADVLDSFYAELRRCRTHCAGRRSTDHRTPDEHDCDERCSPHRCRPLSPTAVRHMHFILSGAFKRAVRWRWVAVSPIVQAEPPPAPKSNPSPPTPAEAVQLLTEAWRDPDWGAFLWVAMTTGARRGELCAVRWSAVDLDEGRESMWLRQAIRKDGDELVEAELKTHQQRRIALDSETVAVLRDHRDRCQARAVALGYELLAGARNRHHRRPRRRAWVRASRGLRRLPGCLAGPGPPRRRPRRHGDDKRATPCSCPRGPAREETWGPRYVANELAGTRQTAAAHRHTAALRAAEADAAAEPAEQERLRGEATQARALAETLDARAEQLRFVDDARARFLVDTAVTRVDGAQCGAELARRHVDDTEPEAQVTADEWLAAHRDTIADDDAHHDITETDLHDNTAQHDHVPDLVETRRVLEVPQPDIREVAEREPAHVGFDRVRVSTPQEAADWTDGARRSLAEITARREMDTRREEEERAEQLGRWHADDEHAVETLADGTTDEHEADDDVLAYGQEPTWAT